MGRSVVALITGLCTAPLFALLCFGLIDLIFGQSGGSDASIGTAYLALIAAILAFVVGGGLAGIATAVWLPPRFRRHALIANSLLLAAMIVGWQVFVAEPSPLEYADASPLLEVEIRLPESIGADAVGAIDFNEGLLDTRHDDLIRREGDFVIIPWDTTPYRVKDWSIQILLQGHENWTRFDLDLPRRPTGSTDWSSFGAGYRQGTGRTGRYWLALPISAHSLRVMKTRWRSVAIGERRQIKKDPRPE